MSAAQPGGPVQRLLSKACDIEAEEVRATLASFSLVLVLMGSYYILRPVRDAMASDWTDAEVSWLWTFTFFFSVIAVSIYGAVVTKAWRVRRLVPGIYTAFSRPASSLFYPRHPVVHRPHADRQELLRLGERVQPVPHLGVLELHGGHFQPGQQSKRLFAFIGAGASVGAIGGPALAAALAQHRAPTTPAADRQRHRCSDPAPGHPGYSGSRSPPDMGNASIVPPAPQGF